MLDHNIAKRTFEQMLVFRGNMGDFLYENKAREIFGEDRLVDIKTASQKSRSFMNFYREGTADNHIAVRKLKMIKSQVDKLLVGKFVKFIAVTGSVAAGTAKDEDDIDVMVVVENGRLWLYRFMVWLKNTGSGSFRRQGFLVHSGSDVKDKICMNLLVEERGLHFDEDLFVLHELYFMVPVFNESYRDVILSSNQWLREKFGATLKSENVESNKIRGFILQRVLLDFANAFCYVGQLGYMLLHRPNYRAIVNNYKKGRAEFFHSSEFKRDILNDLN